MWFTLLGVLAGLLLLWIVLIAALWLAKPDQTSIREALRLLPDLLVLLKRLASDRAMPTGVRVRLWLLLAYLALPIDLVPDFIPVIGYADDAVIVALTLRSVARTAGLDGLRQHWPGSDGGFKALVKVAGLRA
jgi:uncharacterized membrane protein YkvA (DUF1232 family)